VSSYAQGAGSPRERLSFNTDWRFKKGDPADAAGQLDYAKIKGHVTMTGDNFKKGAGSPPAMHPPVKTDLGANISYVQKSFDDSGWRMLNLPHDWGIEGPFRQEYPGETGKLPWWGVGWYRKHFNIPTREKGKRFFLDVDGAMAYAVVWLNGQFVGGWPYGYSSFRLDLTPYMNYGADNVLAIRLDNPPDSSRWYPGGGIYRNVWLVKTSPVHVAHWGTYITTPEVAGDNATVDIKVSVDNQSRADIGVTVKTEVYELGADGKRVGKVVASSARAGLEIPAGRSRSSDSRISLKNPRVWNLRKHNLYTAVTSVEQNGKILDTYDTVFAVRTIKFDASQGFLLNGERVRLSGVCNHHDLGALGAAVNRRALERQIELLQEMGANAIRTSHNPPAPELLDLCDRMGMLVIVEAFDSWKTGKKPNDYQKLFEDWHEKDLRAIVRRDRNHPSVILWSTGNEVREQRTADAQGISAALTRIVREEDPTRLVTIGCDQVPAGYNGFQKTVDVFGYNYKPHEYRNFHEKNPAIPLYGSETASTVSSRGEYFFPVSENKADGKANFQMSSYDLYAPYWATPPDTEFKGQDENPFVIGEFVWTGFDYLGEPTPYNADSTVLLNFTAPEEKGRMENDLRELGKIRVPSRSSYFGILDLCGFKKDRFYIYQASWRPDLPMAHILPHWNWPERVGEITPVHLYTSGDEAELLLNGKSLGRKKKGPLQYRLRWDDVKYEPGELKAVAYKNGRKWAEDSVRTTGPAAAVMLRADRDTIKADGQDLSFITVTVTDKAGLTVPRSHNLVRFEISGPAEIIAVDNGDATSHEPFQAKERKAYNGMALVIVRSRKGVPGAITLKAQSEGLAAAAIRLRSKAAG
jgi:beta-galactosidase